MKQPNIVFILADQHRYDALGCAGNAAIHTPTLDGLAKQGALLENTWCQSPICQPSRASMLTGQYPHELGIVQNFQADFNPEWPTMPRALQSAGYLTGMVGKAHYVGELEKNRNALSFDTEDNSARVAAFGFDHVMEEFDQHVHLKPGIQTPYLRYLEAAGLKDLYIDTLRSVMPFTESHWDGISSPLPPGFEQTDFITDQSVEWIEARDVEKPFYLQLSYVQPHSPLIASEKWARHYAKSRFEHVPQEEVAASAEAWASHMSALSVRSQAHKLSPEYLEQARRTYYAMISAIDESVGRVVEALKSMGFLDNTWIIYASDHGEMMGDHNLMAKQNFYRGSVQVPAIVRPPIPMTWSGSKCPGLTELVDVTATILDIAQAEPLPASRGISWLRQLLEDGNSRGREFVFSEIGGDGDPDSLFWAVRKGPYRVTVEVYSGTVCEVFDLATDPGEFRNLLGTSDGDLIVNDLMPYLGQIPPLRADQLTKN